MRRLASVWLEGEGQMLLLLTGKFAERQTAATSS
jgi:hypothetical protein